RPGAWAGPGGRGRVGGGRADGGGDLPRVAAAHEPGDEAARPGQDGEHVAAAGAERAGVADGAQPPQRARVEAGQPDARRRVEATDEVEDRRHDVGLALLEVDVERDVAELAQDLLERGHARAAAEGPGLPLGA